MLGLVVAEYTFRNHPETVRRGDVQGPGRRWSTPGSWPRWPSSSGSTEHLRLGRGEDQSGGRTKESILADATEAVIGAVYLDGGLAEAERLILSLLSERIAAAVGEPGESDHKSRLQEQSVGLGQGRSPLRTSRVSGPITPGGTWPRCTLLASASERGRGGPRRTPSR